MGLPRKFRQAAIAAGRAGFAHDMTRHFACHYQRGPRLVVTFDHMKARDRPAPRFPWCHAPLQTQGVSHLGIMMKRRNDWYRHADLFDFFDELHGSGFFEQFEDVLFYGTSMGGYGACAFASAAPGARIFAMMPQSTLDRSVMPAETRYRRGFDRGDWEDPRYRDGAEGAATASQVQLMYDPYFAPDRRHADRLSGPKTDHLKCHFAGHHASRMLLLTGMLKPTFAEALQGGVDPLRFQDRFRATRRTAKPYLRHVLQAALERGHAGLASQVMELARARLGADHPFPALARQLAALDQGNDAADVAIAA